MSLLPCIPRPDSGSLTGCVGAEKALRDSAARKMRWRGSLSRAGYPERRRLFSTMRGSSKSSKKYPTGTLSALLIS